MKKRKVTAPKAKKWARRNQLARAVFDAWPCEGLDFEKFWNPFTGLPVEGGGDTLLLFVLREMKDTVDFEGTSEDAVDKVRGIVEQAIMDLDRLDDKMLDYLRWAAVEDLPEEREEKKTHRRTRCPST